MPTTYEAIATVTVGSGGAANIDFTSIPSSYTDLILKISSREDRTDQAFGNLQIRINNDSTSIYTTRNLYASGSTVGSLNNANGTIALYSGYDSTNNATASTFGNNEIYFPNYAGSSNKSFSSDGASETNAATGNAMAFSAGLWASTTAINRITVLPSTGNFVQYSTATLYGIKNS